MDRMEIECVHEIRSSERIGFRTWLCLAQKHGLRLFRRADVALYTNEENNTRSGGLNSSFMVTWCKRTNSNQ